MWAHKQGKMPDRREASFILIDTLVHCGLRALSDRRAAACTKVIQRVRDNGVLANLLAQRTTVSHGYNFGHHQAPSERIPP